MLAKVLSGAIIGIDAYIVDVEVDIAQGLPVFATVGLPDGAVRVVSVVANSPASSAGLRPADILLGAGEEPFSRQNPVRPAVVLAPIGVQWPLDLQRGSKRLVLRVQPQPAPQGR